MWYLEGATCTFDMQFWFFLCDLLLVAFLFGCCVLVDSMEYNFCILIEDCCVYKRDF